VTFLFTDLEGSTRLWEEYPEAMQSALARHDEILRNAISKHNGHIVKTTGDGVHAVFASAADATLAARDGQLALGKESWGAPGELRVRMGLHTGPAEQRDGDYYGTAVNRAARLMSAAHGGQVVISLTTEELLRDAGADVERVALGEHRLRDLSRPEQVFQLSAAGLQEAFGPLRSLDAFPGNLPLQLSSFVGRDSELAALQKALQEARLVTLTGVGGVGKTRLATQLAAELLPAFPDGAWLCELAGVNDADGVAHLVATVLDVRLRSGVGIEESIAEFLRRRNVLLILDNCEHVLDAAARLAARLLQACAGVSIVATSREGLAIDGERVWPLRSLSIPGAQDPIESIAASDAVRLFVDRAEMARPGFMLDPGNAGAVADICRRLDGIPLAIELAAARASAMRPADVAARLDERFRLLTGGRRTAVERHQTLRAAVDWSYALLSKDEQRVFARLGVFAGGFDISAAEAVASAAGLEPWDIVDAVASLVDKSMVVDEEGVDGSTRYGMLETLRQYAIEHLTAAGDVDIWRRRHAEHFTSVAETIGHGLRGADEVLWRTRLMEELDNLRAAVTWSFESDAPEDVELGIGIVTALAIEAYHHQTTVSTWAEAAVDHVGATTPGRRATVLSAAAASAMTRGDWAAAQRLGRAAIAEGAHTDWRVMSFAWVALAYSELTGGDHGAALETLDDCERAVRASGDDYDLAHVLNAASSFRAMVPSDPRALAIAEEAVGVGRRLRNPTILANALYGLAWALFSTDPAAALAAVEESYALMRDGLSTSLYGSVAVMTADLRERGGDERGARDALRAAFRHFDDVGDRPQLVAALNRAVRIFARQGAPGVAATLLGVVADGPLTAINNFPGARWTDTNPTVVRIRTELGAERFAADRAAGAALSYDEIVATVLTAVDQLEVQADA
jgi:predicted ATPase/class 3 adenylate cyclase